MTTVSFLLTEAAGPAVDGAIRTIEPEDTREHAAPEFVLDLSGKAIGGWLPTTYLSPGKHLCEQRNAYVFGQNFVFADGAASCESHAFRLQYIQTFDGPAYRAIFRGLRPELSREAGGWRVDFTKEEVTRIAEPVFLATPVEPDNWARWISTVIPKALWFLSEARGRKFFCRAKLDWQRAVLAAVGVTEGMILDHDPGRVYLCEDLQTIRYGATNLVASHQDGQVYKRLARSYGRDKLFVSRLSRSMKRPRYRVLQNEAELVSEIRELGFRVVEPETLSFSEQVAAFAGADLVAGLGGAGMFNTAFCRPGSAVITIEASDAFIRPHARLFASLGHRYGVVFGREDPEDTSPSHRRWSVDVGMVRSCLKDL